MEKTTSNFITKLQLLVVFDMNSKSEQRIQIFYELSMSVGTSLLLDQMLKTALQAYLRKLNCICAMVYKINMAQNQTINCEIIYSLPIAPYVKEKYKEILRFIPEKFNNEQLENFKNTLTFTGNIGKKYFHVMQLGKFGFLVLIKDEKKLDDEILFSINEINVKLGQACEACLNNNALIESEERYRSMFNNNKSIMLLIDSENGDIVDANKAAINFYKYSKKKLLKMNIKEINMLKDEELQIALNDVALEKKYTFHFKHKLADGDVRDVQIYSSKIIHNNKIVLYSIIHDITLQLKAEKELVKAKEKAEESNKLKTAFLANMSHEIRTPMNSIIGFSDMYLRQDIDEKKRALYANTVMKSSKRLLGIVNDILDISKIKTGIIDLQIEGVTINEIINELYDIYSYQNNKDIIIYKHLDLEDEESIIRTDQSRLMQVMSNLINNALKFTSKGSVSFGYKKERDNLIFFVKDTGIGIAKTYHKKIFEEFSQVELGNTRYYGGTGLGLAISKEIVNFLGGKIWLDSKPDKGSVFYFTIPYNKGNEIKKVKKQLIHPVSDDNFTILVAEDEEINYIYLKEILSSMNINVVRAIDGKEAIEICKENDQIHLVLMDVKMPEINGYEATKIIKKYKPQIPIIAQTAYAMKDDEKKAISAGCDGYISKPIDLEKLYDYIKKYKP